MDQRSPGATHLKLVGEEASAGAGIRAGEEATPRAMPRDCLEYLTYMLRELEVLAANAGYATLAGLLAVATREAEIQLLRAELNQQA